MAPIPKRIALLLLLGNALNAPQAAPADVAGTSSTPVAQSVPATAERYVGYNVGMPLPQRFASRAEATAAGCLFGHLKGPDIDSCVLGAYANGSLNLSLYDRSRDGTYAIANQLVIPSQYHDSTLSLADMLGQRTDWLVIETTGRHGTGIAQRVLFVIAWNGSGFRAVAAESLDYRCSKPTAPADYALRVRHAFKPLGGAPGLLLDYELVKDGRLIGKWNQQLRWSAYGSRFMPYQSRVDLRLEPAIDHILAQLERIRVYSASGPMDPTGDAARWMGRSELMDMLGPACSPSLLYLARDFGGKWALDARRNAQLRPDPPTEGQSAMVLWTDREGLHIKNATYRLDGKEFPLAVRLTGGKSASGIANAVRDGERMVVTIRVKDWSQPLRRVIYREGQNLVIEESGGAAGAKAVTYYARM